MISEQDLEAFGYYEQVEAQKEAAFAAIEKTVRLQNETMTAGVMAFEMALEAASAPMKAAAAFATPSKVSDSPFSAFSFLK